MTTTAKFALVNAAIVAMLTKLYLWDHFNLRIILMAAPISFLILNLAVWYGVRSAARRKAEAGK